MTFAGLGAGVVIAIIVGTIVIIVVLVGAVLILNRRKAAIYENGALGKVGYGK